MSKFTPGPWTMHLGRHLVLIEDESKRKLANVWSGDGIKVSEMQANSILISAAPDMYEALKLVISYLGDSSTWQEGEEILHHHASNALAKAKGGNT